MTPTTTHNNSNRINDKHDNNGNNKNINNKCDKDNDNNTTNNDNHFILGKFRFTKLIEILLLRLPPLQGLFLANSIVKPLSPPSGR